MTGPGIPIVRNILTPPIPVNADKFSSFLPFFLPVFLPVSLLSFSLASFLPPGIYL